MIVRVIGRRGERREGQGVEQRTISGCHELSTGFREMKQKYSNDHIWGSTTLCAPVVEGVPNNQVGTKESVNGWGLALTRTTPC